MNRKYYARFTHALLVVAAYLTAFCISPIWSQEADEYKPQFQKIVYRRTVPTTIQRVAKKVGPTRFFGSFRQGDKNFAVHFYDKGQVRRKREVISEDFERDSCLDVFQLTASKTWRRIQRFTLTRSVGERRDQCTIEAQSLWLDPKNKMIPMVYLKVQEGHESIPVGNLTDIYGILHNQTTPTLFKVMLGYVPYTPSTVRFTKISYPDAQGHLTILEIASDPGETSYIAYGWSGESWKVGGKTKFENGAETYLRWNGTQFVKPSNELRKR